MMMEIMFGIVCMVRIIGVEISQSQNMLKQTTTSKFLKHCKSDLHSGAMEEMMI